MIYLSGAKNRAIQADLLAGTIGFMRTPANGNTLAGVTIWAMDNGCFTDSYPGTPAYLRLLNSLAAHRPGCLFATAPDVVGDAATTLTQFPSPAALIRERGWPVALVAQDGMRPCQVPWSDLDALFIGGSTGWKLSGSARDLIDAAKIHGKWVHAGRVNSAQRFAYFAAVGADSADGTFLAFGPDLNAPSVRSWITDSLNPTLF